MNADECRPTAGPRLAYLVSRYPALSHTFILREVLGLRRRGFDVRVASINPPDRPGSLMTDDELQEAARTYVVKRSRWWELVGAHAATACTRPLLYAAGLAWAVRLARWDVKKLLFGLGYFLEAGLVGRWMGRQRLSHLHVHFANPAATVGLLVSRMFPVTLSITVHGPDEFDDVRQHALSDKIAAASFICCISRFAKSQLMKLSPSTEWNKMEVARLGVDPGIFFPVAAPPGPRPFDILCVGRLVPAKGQQVLIEAVGRLVGAGRAVRLRLIGEGPDRRRLEQQVALEGLHEVVRFEGGITQDRIRSFYQQADMFVLPSFAEGLPVVLMEAMAMELPCVSTWIAGIPELIRPGQDGLLVAPGDVEALTQAIARLMDDPALRSALGREGRDRVVAHYNLDRNVDGLAAIFFRRLESHT
jgi:colanic acid/amylovoran biosynthesis glycosyltransferase